ncbi:MAG TPA: methyltransferase domain-containing protein [candidate division Zixibacteria bacterium]|nr:methyltransferase domain-containing protein [candidate division Zixibacteria bacterium]
MAKENLSEKKYALKIHKSKGEETIALLKEKGDYDYSRDIIFDEGFLWIPTKTKISGAINKDLPKKVPLHFLKKRFNLRSFDVIGDIIVIFIPDEMNLKKNEIGKYLMKIYPKTKAVYREVGKVEGEFRIQKLELIAGKGSETIHKEHGLKFKLDITKVFFSPRQVTERMELTKEIQREDRVCVFFSGIAPIPIYLSKYSSAAKIIGIEINPFAHNYALENLALNKISNVELINGDVNIVISKLIEKELFDCIIMPLPKNSGSFLDIVVKALKINGLLVIYLASSQNKAEMKIKELGRKGFTIKDFKRGAEIAPNEYRYTIIANKNRNLN